MIFEKTEIERIAKANEVPYEEASRILQDFINSRKEIQKEISKDALSSIELIIQLGVAETTYFINNSDIEFCSHEKEATSLEMTLETMRELKNFLAEKINDGEKRLSDLKKHEVNK